MRDSVRIALTLYLPEGRGPFPAVVESLPYRKDDDCFTRDWQTYSYLTDAGIAGVRIDIRGTGASEGVIEDEYTAEEMADAVEVIAWVAAQPWCNGNVGMWGISWGGFSSLQTAMMQPPALKAIVAMHATHDRFATDVHYTGGSIQAAEQGDWPTSMVALNGLPPDPEIVGDRWREMWVTRLEQTPQWLFNWFRHQSRDAYWLRGSPCADYESIRVPTLLIGGWLDGYIDGMLEMLDRLVCPRQAVIGPWGHYRPATGVPAPTLDHFELMSRWFAHQLRGDDNGVMEMPLLTAWVRTTPPYDAPVSTGFWQTWQERTEVDSWEMQLGAGIKTWDGPQWVGSHAPAWDRAVVRSSDPVRDDEASLTFESDPLPADLDLFGNPQVELLVSSDQPAGLVAARMLAVSPAGDAFLICRGSRNLVFPVDFSNPSPPQEGEWRQVRFPLLAASARIPAGWTVRLSLAGADFPIAWPPGQPFRLSVDAAESRLRLPLLPAGGKAVTIPPAPPPPPVPAKVERDDVAWSVDRRDDRTTFERSLAREELQEGRLRYSSTQRWEVTVDDNDPGSTALVSNVELKLERADWKVSALGRVAITADADAFYLEIGLGALEDERAVFERTWRERIDRIYA
ncbi:MAG TPA: CocE/NonD family hydrolase [Acidimicrobiia bacterium]|nr:CocE/NonD family hydrolase [Acidimicrobiia bacterium]